METSDSQMKLEFTQVIIDNIEAIRKWALFLSIVLFVFVCLIVTFGFSFGIIMKELGQEAEMTGFPTFMVGFVYLIFAVIAFFPILFLYRFSTYAKKSVHENDNAALVAAFKNLKSHYTFVGILTAITVGIYLIIGIGFGIFALVT